MGFILSEALRTELSWASANTSTNEKTIVADYLSHRFHRPCRVRHRFAAIADLQQEFRRQRLHGRIHHGLLLADAISFRAVLGPAFRPDRPTARPSSQDRKSVV